MPPDSPELERSIAEESEQLDRSVEREPDELERLTELTVARLQAAGINIDRQRWASLVPEISYAELNADQEKLDQLEYRPDITVALVERTGRVKIDRTEFPRLGEFQQQHVFLHEPGHRLDWLLSSTGNETWRKTGEIIGQMDPNEISFYVHHLAEKYRGAPPEVLAKIIRQEAMPELIAQFVESGGSFKGFVEAMMRSGSGLQGEEAWEGRSEVDPIMARLERFENMTDEERTAFLADHPRFANRYQVFVNLGEALQDDQLIESITGAWEDDYDLDFYDELAMVSEMAPGPPQVQRAPIKKEMPPKKVGAFDIFWLFRKEDKEASAPAGR